MPSVFREKMPSASTSRMCGSRTCKMQKKESCRMPSVPSHYILVVYAGKGSVMMTLSFILGTEYMHYDHRCMIGVNESIIRLFYLCMHMVLLSVELGLYS